MADKLSVFKLEVQVADFDKQLAHETAKIILNALLNIASLTHVDCRVNFLGNNEVTPEEWIEG